MMTPDESGLRQCIEQLYDVFGVYPLADIVEGCPCCTTEQDHDRIHSKPLRQLEIDDLDRFASKALATWGTLDDLKHFLPRLLELLALNPMGFTLPEVFVGRLTYAPPKIVPRTWRGWPEQERVALESYFGALWNWVLVAPGYPEAEIWLYHIAAAFEDLTPFLETWWALGETEGATAQLAFFMYWHDSTLQVGTFDSHWFHDRPKLLEQLADWAKNPKTTQMLKQGLRKVRYHPWLEERGVSQDWIDWHLI